MSVNYYVIPDQPTDLQPDFPEDPGIHLGQWANDRFVAAAHEGHVGDVRDLLALAGSGKIVAEHGLPMTFREFVTMLFVESKPRPNMVEADYWDDGVPFTRAKFF